MEKDCIIMSLVYIERMLSEAAPALCICGSNWKSTILSGMALASKVWDDLSMLNVDFSKIGNVKLHHLNMLEVCPSNATNRIIGSPNPFAYYVMLVSVLTSNF